MNENLNLFSKEIERRGYRIKTTSVTKNGKTKSAVQIFKPSNENRICPAIQMEIFEDPEFDAKRLADCVLNDYNTKFSAMSDFADNLTNWEFAKKHAYVCVRSANHKENTDITSPFLDLEMYVRIYTGDPTAQGVMSAVVNNEMLKKFGILPDELFSTALYNTSKLAKPMVDISSALPIPVAPTGMHIVSTSPVNGAAAMLVLPRILDMSGYILPSSIHEVLFIPDKKNPKTTEELRDIVRSVNESTVSEDDYLSDTVYYYDADKEILTVA